MNTSNDSAGPPTDGVIKFQALHTRGALPPDVSYTDIHSWFGICRALDLIGQHPGRYQGAAYGNISQRAERGFLITGTQTGGKPSLDEKDIAWVRSFDVLSNRVVSQGPANPSSESLTHGQLYLLDPGIGFIIHVHSPLIWDRAGELALPATSADAAYGTPEMAKEVERLMRSTPAADLGTFSMGGHEDGIVVFGETPDQAGLRLLRLYRRACELASPPQGSF